LEGIQKVEKLKDQFPNLGESDEEEDYQVPDKASKNEQAVLNSMQQKINPWKNAYKKKPKHKIYDDAYYENKPIV